MANTICLLGPANGGKSSLLFTMQDCVNQGSYGYPADAALAIREISKEEYEGSAVQRANPIISGYETGSYESERRKFAEFESRGMYEPTSPEDGTQAYYFELNCEGLTGEDSKFFRVIDAAGGIAAPVNQAQIDANKQYTAELETALRQTDAVILVLPLTEVPVGETERWADSLRRVISNLRNTKVRELIVVFSQYERLFMQSGSQALADAAHPWVLESVLRGALKQRPWLRECAQQLPERINVRLTAASAFGFTKSFGIPNIDPNAPGGVEFRFLGRGDSSNAAGLWRPFLTADPFVCALTNELTDYIYDFNDLVPDSRGPAQPPPSRPASPGLIARILAALRGLLDFFNANREGE
jgi:hypothetical protein